LSLFVVMFDEYSYYRAKKLIAKPYYEYTKKDLWGLRTGVYFSFTKCMQEGLEVVKHLEKCGATVMFPIKSDVVDVDTGFVFLIKDMDSNKTPKELQQTVLDKTNKAHFIYLANFNKCLSFKTKEDVDFGECFIGGAAAMETGYAVGKNTRVIAHCQPSNFNISYFIDFYGKEDFMRKHNKAFNKYEYNRRFKK
jgi:hypothetical protein